MTVAARLRPLALAAAIVAATIAAPAATGGAAVCAGEGPQAGLVIDTGSRVIELCVALDAAEVSGLRLIELAGAQHGLSYGFGLGGAAVCRLDGVGPSGDDCFAAYPEYWGYWHGDGGRGWTWASTGAGSYRVGDGDLEGWVWGSGDSGSTHRKPPALGIDDVCRPAPAPSPDPTRDPDPEPEPTRSAPPTRTPTGATSTPAASASEPPDDTGGPGREPDASTRTRTPSPTPTPTTTPVSGETDAPVMALGSAPPADGGPPAGLFVAAALALILAGAGWIRLRARGKGSA